MGGPAGVNDLERPLLADEAEQAAAPGPVVEGAQPSPEAPRPLKPLTQVCPFILANEFCERLAFYGLATNLVNFFGGVFSGGGARLRFGAPLHRAQRALLHGRARPPPQHARQAGLSDRCDTPSGVMQYSKADSAAAVQSWTASCYMTAVVGAVVADSALGRCVLVGSRALRRL